MIDFLLRNPWTATAAAALLAVVVAMIADGVLRRLVKRVTRRSIVMQRVLQFTDRPAAAVIPLAALLLVWQGAPDDLAYIGVVRHATGVLLIAAGTWYAMAFLNGVAEGVIESNPATCEDNLRARQVQTQTRVLSRSAAVVVLIAGISLALMTFPGARQVGASLLASAGVLGIIGGLAARPVFSNMIAGLQLALAQPIRIDDVLIVKGEWGRVEEITGTYVVLKIWDERRLIIPLQWFIENPFENWTRTGSELLGTVFLYVDHATPIEPLRQEAQRVVEADPDWDRRVFAVQVTDITERSVQVRVLVSAVNAGKAFDLRCRVREKLLAFLAREYPQCLPLLRTLHAGESQAALPVVGDVESLSRAA